MPKEIHWIRSDKRVNILDEIEGLIRAYVAIWGSEDERDSYGTWFDRTRPPEMDLDLLPIALRYEHGMDGEVTHERIGEIFEIGFDDVGIYFKAHLDKSSAFFERVVVEIKDGTPDGPLRTSSGTVSYLAEFFEDGAFKIWPVAEVSLTSMPAESRMPDVELLRSERPSTDEVSANGDERDDEPEPNEPITNMTENRQMDINEIFASLPEGASLEDVMAALLEAGIPAEDIEAALAAMIPPEEGAEEMPEGDAASERSAFVSAFSSALKKIQDAKQEESSTEEARNMRNERNKLLGENALLRSQMNAPPPKPAPRGDMSQSGHISGVSDLRYAHLNAQDMALGHQMLRTRNINPSESYMRALAVKTHDVIERGATGWTDPKGFYAVRSAFPFRADELFATNIATQGQEWVGVQYINQLWERIRQARIMDMLLSQGIMVLEVQQGANSVVVPLETADPTWYKVAEANSLDATGRPEVTVGASTPTTANLTVTPSIVKARVVYTEELVEDSLIAVLPQTTKQLNESGADMVENLFLNGDTATAANTNINLIDGTPVSGITAPFYLASNGALKLALVTNTANSRDGGTLDSSDFLATRGLHPDNLAADPSNMLYVSDTRTNIKALEMLDVKTRDVFQGATIENGSLTGVWGQPYLVSGQMALANTAGKISATAGNNTKGRLLSIVPKYWALVWKRQMTIESAKDIDSGATTVVASMRLAFQQRTNEASAVSYNLTV
jgi:hypothetical protein